MMVNVKQRFCSDLEMSSILLRFALGSVTSPPVLIKEKGKKLDLNSQFYGPFVLSSHGNEDVPLCLPSVGYMAGKFSSSDRNTAHISRHNREL
jgi:hypothetical protein